MNGAEIATNIAEFQRMDKYNYIKFLEERRLSLQEELQDVEQELDKTNATVAQR